MYRALNSHNPAHFAAMDVALQLEEVYFQVVQDAAQDVVARVEGALPPSPRSAPTRTKADAPSLNPQTRL